MMRQIKKSAFLAALAISSVLACENIVFAWNASLTAVRLAVDSVEKARAKLEEERKKLLEDYGVNHERVKAVEDEILDLAKEYPSLLTRARERLEKEVRTYEEEIAKSLEQGMKPTGKTVTELEAEKTIGDVAERLSGKCDYA